MAYNPFPQGSNHAPSNQGVAGGDTVSSHPVFPSPRGNGMTPRRPTIQLPPSSYLPGPSGSSPSSAASSQFTYSPRRDRVTPLTSPSFISPHAIPYYPHQVRGQQDEPSHPRLLQDGPLPMSFGVAGPSRGFPGTALPSPTVGNPNTHVSEYQRSNSEQPAFGGIVPSPSLYGYRSEWAGTQHIVPSLNHRASGQGGGGYQGQIEATRGSVTSDPRFNLAQQSNAIANSIRSVPVPGQPSWEMSRNPHDLHQTAGPNHGEIPSFGTSHQNEGVTNFLQYPGPGPSHRLSDERFGNGSPSEAIPPNPRSLGVPNQPAGIQRSKRSGKTGKTADATENTTGRKMMRRKKRTEFQYYVAQLTANPIVNPGAVQLIRAPQVRYKCPQKQDGWEKAPPIDFGNLKLTVAANPTYNGFQGAEEPVLCYKGVGSSVSCRINIAGHRFGPWKILTTDSKINRQCITKGRVAYEVARFVWENIGKIQNTPDCDHLTFQNLVLVRMVHVSKASWQAEFWYEAPAIPGPSRS